MDEKRIFKIVISVLLIGIGTLALLTNLEVIRTPWRMGEGGLVWVVLFSISGLAFLGIYLRGSNNAWAIIPGFTLVGLGIIVGDIFPIPYEFVAVAVFMSLLGLGFLGAYWLNRKYWGLVIPAGILLSLAFQTIFSRLVTSQFNMEILLLGTALTLLGTYFAFANKRRWLLYVAGLCFLLGLVGAAGSVLGISLILPVALVVIGGIVIWRTFRSRER